MKNGAVNKWCATVWEMRENWPMVPMEELSRTLALAVATDVASARGYAPCEDRRLEWAAAIVARRRAAPRCVPYATADLEFLVAFELGKAPQAVQERRDLTDPADLTDPPDFFSSTLNPQLSTTFP